MRAQAAKSPLAALAALATALAALLAGVPAPGLASPDAGEPVDCKLPPQIRSLGRNVTYLAAGRLVRISAAECGQRGGTWNGRGPGKLAGAGGPLAVTVGGDASAAACPLQASVAGLRGSSTLAVRAGPGTGFARVDGLRNGSRVFLCDRSGDAGWVGIVYGAADCGLSAPITPPRAYAGACRSGWVRSNYLR
jgi:hypothetical protein